MPQARETTAAIPGILHKPGALEFLNPAMMAMNTFEVDLPHDLIAELQVLVPELQRMDEAKRVGRLGNGVNLYVDRPKNWDSDIRWVSNADEPAYRWFEGLFARSGLARLVAPLVPHDHAIRLYAGSFVTRSVCNALDMHCDWTMEGNHAFALMAPLTASAAEMGMTYVTIRGEMRQYAYRVGRGLVFGPQFIHSTAVGRLDERAVFLCFNFGTDRMDHWAEISATTAKQGEFYCQPDGTFLTRAEWSARYGTPREDY